MLGYCMSCETLRSIRPGPQKWGSRERRWFPIPHDAPARHRGCGGVVVELDIDGMSSEFECEACERAVLSTDVEPSPGPCDGDTREIK